MTTITTITLTTFFTSLVLFAQETQRPAGGRLAERFKQLDRNGDGKLSAEEFPGAQFKQMDKDGDGFATMEELRASLGDRGPVRPAAEQPARTAPRIVWQVSIGGKSDLPKRGSHGHRGTGQMPRVVRGVSADGEGGVFFCGSFFDKCSLGGQTLSSAGAADVMVGRLNNRGEVAWFRGFGARGTDIAPDVATDNQGNCVLTGMCSPGTRFDSTTMSTAGGSDAFAAKFDQHGAVLWVKLAGGPSPDCGNEVCVDRDDNVLVVGNTYGEMKAGSDEWPHAGGMDCFVLKYSCDGKLLWAVPITGPADEQGRGIAVDSSGHVVVVGEFNGAIRIGDTQLTAAGGRRDLFVARFTPSGKVLWAKRFGDSGEDYGRGVGCDSQGNILVAGVFSGRVAFGNECLQAGGGENLFLLKLSSGGEVVWVRGMTGSGQGHGCEIEVTADGRAVLSGDVMGELFIGETPICSTGRRETFVAGFDADGRLDWLKPIHGTGTAANFAIAMDSSGRATVAGSFTGTLETGEPPLRASADMESFLIAMDTTPAEPRPAERATSGRISQSRGRLGTGRTIRGEGEKRPADATHASAGPHKVREVEFTIPAERWQKTMALRVYFPADGGPYPLIVFCAGSGGGNDTFPDTSIYMASHGYVVLHTSYDFGARGGGNAELTRNRVADIVLALNSLDKFPEWKPELKGKINRARIGACGHSSGAYITQLLGGATVVFDGKETSFRDERVKAIIQYSGQGSGQQGLTKDSWKNLTIRMLTFTGTKDRGATGGGSEWKKEPFDLSPAGNKYHVCYEGGHHGSFSGKFARDTRGKAIFEHSRRLSLVFWDACLKDDQKSLGLLKSQEPSRWNDARLEYFHR